MIKLPADEVLHPKISPKNFFIYGKTMSGKSFFSSYFPHPIVLNTDGNSAQGTAPSIQIRNVRDANGNLTEDCMTTINDIVIALQQPDVTFKTVVIDVVDDICVMIEQAICIKAGVSALSDIPYGKGFAMFNSFLQQMVMDLKALPMNVIYISRELENTDEATGATKITPSLKSKYYNIVNGNCDLVVRTYKAGNEHYRMIMDKRADYKPEDIEDERVKQLLESCQNMFN